MTLLVCGECGEPMEPGKRGGKGRKRFCSDQCRARFAAKTKRAAVEDLGTMLDELADDLAPIAVELERVQAVISGLKTRLATIPKP